MTLIRILWRLPTQAIRLVDYLIEKLVRTMLPIVVLLLIAGLFLLCLQDGFQILLPGEEAKFANKAKTIVDEASTQLLGDLKASIVENAGDSVQPPSQNSKLAELQTENDKLRDELMVKTGLHEAYRARLLDSMEHSRQWEEAALERIRNKVQNMECNCDGEIEVVE